MVERVPARFEVLDERFAGTGGDRWMDRVFDDGRWLEGPAYHPAGRFVLFSDIPNDRVLRYDEISGRVDVFAQPAGFTNGRTVDRAGPVRHLRARGAAGDPERARRLDQGAGRRVRGPSAEQPERRGRALRRVDLVHRPDLRDPAPTTRAIRRPRRSAPTTSTGSTRHRRPTRSCTDFAQPNGLAFAPDEQRLFVVDSELHHIRVFDCRPADSHRWRGVRRRRPGLRRHPVRPSRPTLGSGPRRPALLRAGRIADRQAAGARDRGQPHLRRPAAATTSTSPRRPRCITLRVNFRAADYPR